jgi:hypothetical protein
MKRIRVEQSQSLLKERAKLMAEFEALKNKISGLDLAIRLIADQADRRDGPNRRETVTTTIRSLLSEAGTHGLNAKSLAELAEVRGLSINRNSLSSLLSRMKRNGELVYRQRRYVLRDAEGIAVLQHTPADGLLEAKH